MLIMFSFWCPVVLLWLSPDTGFIRWESFWGNHQKKKKKNCNFVA